MITSKNSDTRSKRIHATMLDYNRALDQAELLMRNSPTPEPGKMPEEHQRAQCEVVNKWLEYEQAVMEGSVS